MIKFLYLLGKLLSPYVKKHPVGSGILTALSAKFNFNDKRREIEQLIDKLDKLNQTTDYVILCNGSLTEQEYERLLKEFVETDLSL